MVDYSVKISEVEEYLKDSIKIYNNNLNKEFPDWANRDRLRWEKWILEDVLDFVNGELPSFRYTEERLKKL